jgi:hypothetical protein
MLLARPWKKLISLNKNASFHYSNRTRKNARVNSKIKVKCNSLWVDMFSKQLRKRPISLTSKKWMRTKKEVMYLLKPYHEMKNYTRVLRMVRTKMISLSWVMALESPCTSISRKNLLQCSLYSLSLQVSWCIYTRSKEEWATMINSPSSTKLPLAIWAFP